MIELLSGQLSGWDFLIAGLIVMFVEFVVKLIFKQKAVTKIAPIVLGAVVYLVLGFINGGVWYSQIFHGLIVGLAAMGSYDLLLKTMKEGLTADAKDLNEKAKSAIIDKKEKD